MKCTNGLANVLASEIFMAIKINMNLHKNSKLWSSNVI